MPDTSHILFLIGAILGMILGAGMMWCWKQEQLKELTKRLNSG